jgi:hypothetical protein
MATEKGRSLICLKIMANGMQCRELAVKRSNYCSYHNDQRKKGGAKKR